jgi:hypothetical protein
VQSTEGRIRTRRHGGGPYYLKRRTDEAHTDAPARTPARKETIAKIKAARADGIDANERQRAAVAGRTCLVCGGEKRIDPAHLIPRSLGGCGDALCGVPLCRRCARAYDRRERDLLPYLEPAWRAQLGHAVGHVGLIRALRRISGNGRSEKVAGQ